MNTRSIVVTGANGFIGRHLLPMLLACNYRTVGISRNAYNLPQGVEIIKSDILQPQHYIERLPAQSTLVHLIGIRKPAPWKNKAFLDNDLASVQCILQAAQHAKIQHIIYMSVAQPAPIMRGYVTARAQAEHELLASGIPCSILRPWYVLGPGRHWPLFLQPLHRLLQCIPIIRNRTQHLDLIRLKQLLNTLLYAIEHPPQHSIIYDVPVMKQMPNQSILCNTSPA